MFPHLCRPYLVNLLPCLTRTSKRPEESVQETLAAAIPKIMASFGNFANDNEIKVCLAPQAPNPGASVVGVGLSDRRLAIRGRFLSSAVLPAPVRSIFPLLLSYCGCRAEQGWCIHRNSEGAVPEQTGLWCTGLALMLVWSRWLRGGGGCGGPRSCQGPLVLLFILRSG